MNMFAIIGIALGLSLDAFTVALTNSAVIEDLHVRHGFRMAVFFGFFQFAMPIVGWAAGLTFTESFRHVDHWIAFGLLAFVGGRMIWSAFPLRRAQDPIPDGGCSDEAPRDCRSLSTLFMLSIATSIDALAVGLSFAMVEVEIVVPALTIGAVTFAVSLAGYAIGRRIRRLFAFRLEIAGGIILILIGVKIVADHLAA